MGIIYYNNIINNHFGKRGDFGGLGGGHARWCARTIVKMMRGGALWCARGCRCSNAEWPGGNEVPARVIRIRRAGAKSLPAHATFGRRVASMSHRLTLFITWNYHEKRAKMA